MKEVGGWFEPRHRTRAVGHHLRTRHPAGQQRRRSCGHGFNGTVGRSSWKKAWGLEPPGWRTRGAQAVEVLTISPSEGTSLRDVFSGPGRLSLSLGDESDWVDEDDDIPYAAVYQLVPDLGFRHLRLKRRYHSRSSSRASSSAGSFSNAEFTELVMSSENKDADISDLFLLPALHQARLIKDQQEIDWIRKANEISSRAHEVVMRVLGKAVKGAIERGHGA
ncbi:hypothetical protein EV360DRAFT_88325 [Lentinula raphanica]|nr:hypothetical protein EV360DRAFT_88325 [Lentinula raphanica]